MCDSIAALSTGLQNSSTVFPSFSFSRSLSAAQPCLHFSTQVDTARAKRAHVLDHSNPWPSALCFFFLVFLLLLLLLLLLFQKGPLHISFVSFLCDSIQHSLNLLETPNFARCFLSRSSLSFSLALALLQLSQPCLHFSTQVDRARAKRAPSLRLV